MARFWGIVLEGGRRYIQTVEAPFCMSMAVLEHKSDSKDTKDKPIRLFVERDNIQFCIGLLSSKNNQLPLRLKFGKGETIALFMAASEKNECEEYKIHLTGYSSIPDGANANDPFLGMRAVPFKGQKQSILVTEAKSGDNKSKKRVSIKESPHANREASSDDDDDSEDDSDDGLEPMANGVKEDEESDDVLEVTSSKNVQKRIDAEASSDDDDDDDDEEDDDEEDDSDEDSDEVVMAPKEEKNPKKKEQAQQNQNKGKQQQQSPNASKQSPKGNDNKRKSETAVTQTPENKLIKQKLPSSAGHTPMKFFSKQGVMCQDLKVGAGNPAKPGKNVNVYYTGRLKSNNKVFDASQKGPGFKFRLGKGEVIRGWDLGVEGMKIGGKRRLIIPANLAYGKRGAPPDIPPNSTLVFDVELKNVS